nr:MAG TPA: hypothetical protein [Caudoviricetes sp.]
MLKSIHLQLIFYAFWSKKSRENVEKSTFNCLIKILKLRLRGIEKCM